MNSVTVLIGTIVSSAMTMLGLHHGQAPHAMATPEPPIIIAVQEEETQALVADPLPNLDERETLLTFGLFVTPDPEQNPIDPPERFIGFHAATDFEILDGEEDVDVPVSALCDGTVLYASTADGYGGVIVQSCVIDGEDVTVLYGHLDTDFAVSKGDAIIKGQQIAILAQDHSAESGDTRKHLHLGIHRGKTPDYLGYVQHHDELTDFIDPMTILRPTETNIL